MKIKKLLMGFAIAFAAAFAANAIVVYVWNVIRHGEGAFDWGRTFVLAITLGIVLPLLDAWRSKGP